MNAAASREKANILLELNQIVRELEAAAVEVSRERGVGAERCAAALFRRAYYYRGVRSRLLNLQ